jgi:hypothetical protein
MSTDDYEKMKARIEKLETERDSVIEETHRWKAACVKSDARTVELKCAIMKLHQAALPDSFDERDIDLEWLIKQIYIAVDVAREDTIT